jgi:hypothetical protein
MTKVVGMAEDAEVGGESAPEAAVARQLKELQADRERSALLSAYVAALIDDAGWGVEAVGGLIGASRQSISKRRKQGREVRAGYAAELAALPLPQAPVRQRTRSGLLIPDADEIAARESAWVEGEVGGPLSAAEVPARLKLVAGLLEDAENRVELLRRERAELAWSLVCFDPGARQGLQKAGHWQPDEFFAARTEALAPAAGLKTMDDRALAGLARERGVRPITNVEEAREDYFTVTTRFLAAQARRRAVTEVRDRLVRRFVQRDVNGRWKGVTEVAGWIGRSQSQVTQICDAGS